MAHEGRRLRRDVRGAGVVEKLIIVGLFALAIVGGVSALSGGSDVALTRYAGCVGSGRFDCRPGTVNGANASPATADVSGKPKPQVRPACDGPACMCFVAGTLVITATGAQAIETIAPGTMVLARDEAGDLVEWKPVVRTFVSRARSLIHLTMADADGRQLELQTTREHPFFTEGRGWSSAAALMPGQDRLIDRRGRAVELTSAESRDEQVPVYNLEVADHHTYFVGESGIWVHNTSARTLRARVVLRRPGNPVGRVVPIQFTTPDGAVLRVDATVTDLVGTGPNRTFEATWTDANGQVFTGRLDRDGNVVTLRRPPPAVGATIRVNDTFHGSQYDAVVTAVNPDGSVRVEGRDGNGVRRWGTVDGNGVFAPASTVIGRRRPVTDIFLPEGPTYDVLVIAENDDGGLEVEGLYNGQRRSGTLFPNAGTDGGDLFIPKEPKHNEMYVTGNPIAGLPVTDTETGGKRIGRNIVVLPPIEPRTGWSPEERAAANKFIEKALDDLNTIASKPSGRRLLLSLENEGGPGAEEVRIDFTADRPPAEGAITRVRASPAETPNAFWNIGANRPGPGKGATVFYNPSRQGYPMLPSTNPWAEYWDMEMLESFQAGFGRVPENPSDVTLLHELIHADNIRKGSFIHGSSTFGATVSAEEERAAGLGDFHPDVSSRVSENAYRRERKLTLRSFYVKPNETHTTTAARTFTADLIASAHSGDRRPHSNLYTSLNYIPGSPVPAVVEQRSPVGRAQLHLLVKLDHNHLRNALPRGATGHTWIALDVPPENIPARWQVEFPDHYEGLVNGPNPTTGRKTPLGHHVGFYPARNNNLSTSLFKRRPGSLELELGRSLDAVSAVQTYDVSVDEVERVLRFIEDNRTRAYNGFRQNCVDFAACAVRAANQTMPRYKGGRVGLPNVVFEAILQRQAAGDPNARASRLATFTLWDDGTPRDEPVRMPRTPLVGESDLPRPAPDRINAVPVPNGNMSLRPIPPATPPRRDSADRAPMVLPEIPTAAPLVVEGCG
ncbi:MAG TPA: polymorphic toxin-type HINT domain-containing protein [Polyangia bacterium]